MHRYILLVLLALVYTSGATFLRPNFLFNLEGFDGLSVEVDTSRVGYTVSLDGNVWLESSAFAVHSSQWSSWKNSGALPTDSELSVQDISKVKSSDLLGPFDSVVITWGLSSGATWKTRIQVYENISAIVFLQQFPSGLDQTELSGDDDNEIIAAFPTFSTAPGTKLTSLGYTTLQGIWDVGTTGVGLSGYSGGVAGGVPLVLVDRDSSDFRTAVLSRFRTTRRHIIAFFLCFLVGVLFIGLFL